MSKGILYFGIGENYTKMAEKSAKILKEAGFNTAIITDSQPDSSIFDHIITKDAYDFHGSIRVINDSQILWRNGRRSLAYQLTPFDKTLVLDADFFCDPKDVTLALECDQSLMISDNVYPIDHPLHQNEITLWSRGIPMKWATVFAFDKNKLTTKLFFTMCTTIEENYDHYTTIHGCNNGLYRNDYVFSIAANYFSHAEFVKPLPFDYGFADQSINIDELRLHDFRSILSHDNSKSIYYGSIHCLNKKSYMECKVI